jgi:hypothetical protein
LSTCLNGGAPLIARCTLEVVSLSKGSTGGKGQPKHLRKADVKAAQSGRLVSRLW